MRSILRAVPVVVAAFACATGPAALAAAGPPGIKWVAALHVNSIRGADTYNAYCAACHGKTGRGDGPAVKFLAEPVPDLTRIGERDGKFNVTHVRHHIISRPRPYEAMPDWQEVMRMNYSSEGWAHLAIHNLVTHVERLQNGAAKATR